MEPLVAAVLFATALVGGALNSVAGGGSFFTFPALLLAGVPPVPANATSAAALWPAGVTGIHGYRDDLRHARHLVPVLGAASVAGGLLGALVLVATPPEAFRLLVPFLLLTATLVFGFAPALLKRLGRAPHGRRGVAGTVAMGVAWLVIATYGGYFGGGMGFLMLATLASVGMTDIHAMNGLKVVMGTVLNGVAIVVFAVKGIVDWPLAALMATGSLAGGFAGPRLAKRVDAAKVRLFVLGVGAALTLYFFWATYA